MFFWELLISVFKSNSLFSVSILIWINSTFISSMQVINMRFGSSMQVPWIVNCCLTLLLVLWPWTKIFQIPVYKTTTSAGVSVINNVKSENYRLYSRVLRILKPSCLYCSFEIQGLLNTYVFLGVTSKKFQVCFLPTTLLWFDEPRHHTAESSFFPLHSRPFEDCQSTFDVPLFSKQQFEIDMF